MNKLVLTQRLHEDGMKLLEGNVDVAIADTGNPREYGAMLVDAQGIIVRIGTIDREAMLAAPHLAVIGRTGVGVDNVDLKCATELGIPVVVTPGANTLSVAEQIIALMFAAAKELVLADSSMRRGDFQVRNRFRAFEVAGKAVGLIGYGNIGKEVARLAAAVGMKVTVYDPLLPPGAVETAGLARADSVEALLRNSDIVSLHVPLTKDTRGLVNAERLALMKPGAVLINCSRGEIVVEPDLVAALEGGVIACAALDVFAREPVPADNPLLALPNVIVTPHMAAQTREAASRMATRAAEGVLAVMRGERWTDVANPAAYDHPRWRQT